MAVLVGTVTDDVRLFKVPKVQVACLRATETARARILAVRSPFSPLLLCSAEGCALWSCGLGLVRMNLPQHAERYYRL